MNFRAEKNLKVRLRRTDLGKSCLEYFAELWTEFLEFLRTQPPAGIYFFLFLGAFLENVVPPIPGDTLIVFGAYLAGIGIIRAMPVYLSMFAGSALGCMLVYLLAYLKGRELFMKWEPRIFTEDRMRRGEAWFDRYGPRVVIFNRFLPTVRVFIGVVAGLSRMHPVRMFAYVLLATLLWNSLLVYFGLMVGENWGLVVDVLKAYNRVLIALMVIAGAVIFLWRRKPKCAKVSGEAGLEEAPEPVDPQAQSGG